MTVSFEDAQPGAMLFQRVRTSPPGSKIESYCWLPVRVRAVNRETRDVFASVDGLPFRWVRWRHAKRWWPASSERGA